MAEAQGEPNAPNPRNSTQADGPPRRAADEAAQGRSFAQKEAQQAAKAGSEAARDSVRAGAEAARSALGGFAETVNRTFGFGDERAGELAQQSARNIRNLSDAATAMSCGAQDIWREWLKASQDGARAQVEAVNRLVACRSAPDLIAAQSELWREQVERTVNVSQAIARTSLATMEDAGRALRA